MATVGKIDNEIPIKQQEYTIREQNNGGETVCALIVSGSLYIFRANDGPIVDRGRLMAASQNTTADNSSRFKSKDDRFHSIQIIFSLLRAGWGSKKRYVCVM